MQMLTSVLLTMVGVTTIVMTLLVALSAAAWMGTHWVRMGEAAVVSHQLEACGLQLWRVGMSFHPPEHSVIHYTYYIYLLVIDEVLFSTCVMQIHRSTINFWKWRFLNYSKAYHEKIILLPAISTLNGSCIHGELRLEGGSDDMQAGTRDGRVEICINNAWGTVCDTLFGRQDAEVVCRQLDGFQRDGMP